jgi:hypothetical protein
MGMIKIYQGRSKNQKRKPGWKQEAEAYQAWMKQVGSMTSGIRVSSKPKPVVKPKPVQPQSSVLPAKYVVGTGSKAVPRPELQYKDDPEMLERELRARERKFTTAPVYNKGGDVLITDEMMKDIMAGVTRRRG